MISEELLYTIGITYLVLVIIGFIVPPYEDNEEEAKKALTARSNAQYQALIKAQFISDQDKKAAALRELLATPKLDPSVRADAEESLRELRQVYG